MIDVRDWRFQRLADSGLAGIVCFLPHNVLMLSGYRPRLGNGVVFASDTGEVRLAVPPDEVDRARATANAEVISYETGSLTELVPAGEAMGAALDCVVAGIAPGARIGYEDQPAMTPNAYVSTLHMGSAAAGLLARHLPSAELQPASELLRELRSRLAGSEIARLRDACELGRLAFEAAREVMQPGRAEYEVAAAARAALTGRDDPTWPADERERIGEDRGGEAWVMSGPNSALAYRAFAATGSRRLQPGDLVLVHMNPQASGFWSDLTRTFILGEPDRQGRAMLDAVLEARRAALAATRNQTPARDVDTAARRTLQRLGFGSAFKHQTGHGVGFNGISGADSPSLHPASGDLLAPGMCFNIEPAIYFDGFGGCRHCDVVSLQDDGLIELSPYLASIDSLIVPC